MTYDVVRDINRNVAGNTLTVLSAQEPTRKLFRVLPNVKSVTQSHNISIHIRGSSSSSGFLASLYKLLPACGQLAEKPS